MLQLVEKCKTAINSAIVDALNDRKDYIAQIERTGRGELPITGIALELFPWHSSLGLSLRSMNDFPAGDSRYDSADWEHFNFTNECDLPSIDNAINLVSEIYEKGRGETFELTEMAHLAFVAGAEALLQPNVCDTLNNFDIRAPSLSDSFVSSPFEYIVMDGDETVKSNYCDIVLANRVMQRLAQIAE